MMSNSRMLILAIAFLSAHLAPGAADAEIVPVYDFSFFCTASANPLWIRTADGDPVMVRDPDTWVESPIVGTDYWSVGFVKTDPSSGVQSVIGFARNLLVEEYYGLLDGLYLEGIADGEVPDDMLIIHDVAKDGLGWYDDQADEWSLGEDDLVYEPDDILFGPAGIRGPEGLSLLPPYSLADAGTGEMTALPHMVVAPRILGDSDDDGDVDGADLASWQMNYDPVGDNDNTFEDGDWDEDGDVDGADLAAWQQAYDPVGPGSGLSSVPEPATLALLILGGVTLAAGRRKRK